MKEYTDVLLIMALELLPSGMSLLPFQVRPSSVDRHCTEKKNKGITVVRDAVEENSKNLFF